MYTISNKTEDFIKCVDEQAFKKLYCNNNLRQRGTVTSVQKLLCIETEETIPGFPDVMELTTFMGRTDVKFYEFKISDSRGNIHFQPTQLPFYRNNWELCIKIIAYNRKSQRVHVFSVDEISNKESHYYTKNCRINLSAVEKEIGV